MDKRGRKGVFLIVLSILVILCIAVYFTFFFKYNCEDNDIECFRSHQTECLKTEYISDDVDVTWGYDIKGREGNVCEIDVKIIKVKGGMIENKRLEGKEMTCSIVYGSSESPESDTSRCKGELKEEMQALIIQKLHAYIVSNLGQIDSNLNSIDIVKEEINNSTNSSL